MDIVNRIIDLALSPAGRVVDFILLFFLMEGLKKLRPSSPALATVVRAALLALAPASLILATGGSAEEVGSTALTTFLSAAGLYSVASNVTNRADGETIWGATLRAFRKRAQAADVAETFEKVASGELTVEEGAEKLLDAEKARAEEAKKDKENPQ